MSKTYIPSTAAAAGCKIIWTSRATRIVLVIALLIASILVVTLLGHLSVTQHVIAGGNSWGEGPAIVTRGRALPGTGQGLLV